MDPNKRPEDMERITTPELAQAFINEKVEEVRAQVGDKNVLLALSGGVDSSVVAALLIGHRQAAHLRPREPRPYAQGRKRTGCRRLQEPARRQPRLRRRHRSLP
ncbi:MAG: asparagine synthase-related protein [Slackia sp.]